MKAYVENVANGKQFLIKFSPDTPKEAEVLKEMAESDINIINFRGYEYMNPMFEFLCQESRGGRD